MKRMTLIPLLLLGVIAVPMTGAALETDDWQFELAPFYLWAIGIDGDSGVRDNIASVEVDFGDIWDNLEGVLTVRFNALYKQKFGLNFDYNYLDLGKEQQAGDVNIEAGFKSQMLSLAGSYRLMDGEHRLDALAGIRYTSLELDLNLLGTGHRIERKKDWVDPVIGLRYSLQMADRWAFRLYGDIGGFGVASDFTWQGLGLIDFQPWKYVAIVGGYRAIGTDYESGGETDRFTYDVIVHGPVVGVNIRF